MIKQLNIIQYHTVNNQGEFSPFIHSYAFCLTTFIHLCIHLLVHLRTLVTKCFLFFLRPQRQTPLPPRSSRSGRGQVSHHVLLEKMWVGTQEAHSPQVRSHCTGWAAFWTRSLRSALGGQPVFPGRDRQVPPAEEFAPSTKGLADAWWTRHSLMPRRSDERHSTELGSIHKNLLSSKAIFASAFKLLQANHLGWPFKILWDHLGVTVLIYNLSNSCRVHGLRRLGDESSPLWEGTEGTAGDRGTRGHIGQPGSATTQSLHRSAPPSNVCKGWSVPKKLFPKPRFYVCNWNFCCWWNMTHGRNL